MEENLKKGLQMVVINRDKAFIPSIEGTLSISLTRKGSPGKLFCKLVMDDVLDIEEGNTVQISYNGKEFFKGFIFTLKHGRDRLLEVTAYDQVRYLKNKDIYEIQGEKASDLLRRIAGDFKLTVGDIEDTDYIIPRMRASNQTLIDTIQTALDHTIVYGSAKKMFVLYDDYGELCLKSVGNMDVDILIDAAGAQDFSFESSIDKDVYNRIKLYEDNKDTGKREVYIAEDTANQARWGILQLCESVNSKKCLDITGKAKIRLQTYDYARKGFSVKGAFGDVRVRPGSRIFVNMPVKGLGNDKNNDGNRADGAGEASEGGNGENDKGNNANHNSKAVQMMVESVTHKFGHNEYFMDLELKGRALGNEPTTISGNAAAD